MHPLTTIVPLVSTFILLALSAVHICLFLRRGSVTISEIIQNLTPLRSACVATYLFLSFGAYAFVTTCFRLVVATHQQGELPKIYQWRLLFTSHILVCHTAKVSKAVIRIRFIC